MGEPEKPDPSKPWCPKCIGHTPFEKRESRHADAPPPSFYCKHCNGTKMHLPDAMAFVKIISGYAEVACMLMGIGGSLIETDLKTFYWFGGLGLASFFMSWWANRRFSKWRGWAKENDYPGD